MATSNGCSVCNNGPGTCLCTGCKTYFCRKHFNDHHAILLKKLDEYVEERNTLQDQINKPDSHDDSRNATLLQIDEWQRTMIEKIIQVAEQARQQINLPNSIRLEMMTKFKNYSDKLVHLKETEDFVEDDLTQVKNMLDTLKEDMKELAKLPLFELHVEQSEQIAWNRLLYVEEKTAATENNEEQQGATDPKCRTCGRSATMRCAKCFTVFYCNKKCRTQDWRNHKANCTPTRTLNSADHLVKAAMDDVFPEDLDTLNDFGFSKCHVQAERTNLLGLYGGLIRLLKVESTELHRWQQTNQLALHIRKTYENAGATSYYYSWFLNNQHLVNSQTRKADVFELVRKYLSPEDKDKDITQLEPVAKLRSVSLYVILLMGNIPRIGQEIWVDFGFCTCKNQTCESELGRVYRALIDRCTLYEFYRNYESTSLETLLRSKNIDGVDLLKKQGVVFGNPSISAYYLKQYVLEESTPLQRSVSVDYGFDFCNNKKQKQKLRKIYMQLFEHPNFNILHLHEACISGDIYKYASQFVKADANLMRNLYPLPDI